MTNKSKTAAELREEAQALLAQAAKMGKDEVQELVHEIVERFQKIKKAISDYDLEHTLEDFFDDMEEDDVVGATDKPKDLKSKGKKKDLEEIRFLINSNNTDTAPFVAPKPRKAKRKTWTPEKKAKIIYEYDAAKQGKKTAVLEAHGIKGNPITTWKTNKDVKTAMQKIQEKKSKESTIQK